jgi:hypothetical protein
MELRWVSATELRQGLGVVLQQVLGAERSQAPVPEQAIAAERAIAGEQAVAMQQVMANQAMSAERTTAAEPATIAKRRASPAAEPRQR